MEGKPIQTLGDSVRDISRRYADNLNKLEEVQEFLTKSDLSKDVSISTYGATPTEIAKLLGQNKTNQSFAELPPPPENFMTSLLFVHSVLSSLSSVEEIKKMKQSLLTAKELSPLEKIQQRNIDNFFSLLESLQQIHEEVVINCSKISKG